MAGLPPEYVWGVDGLVLRDRDANGEGLLEGRRYALTDGRQTCWRVCFIGRQA